MGGTLEHIVPQLLQAARCQGDVILERQAGSRRDKPNEKSRLHEEGILSRGSRDTIVNWLVLKALWREGFLERLVPLRGLASPLPGMGVAPLPHPFDVGGAAEVIAVVGFVQPTTLTGRFAGLSAWRLGTGVLPPHVAEVRIKACLTVLALALSHVTYHWPLLRPMIDISRLGRKR